ncbi:hypothetical protein [Meiothermus cerbereus]|uniref:hypothetical protein n=1 Tax=Meiothermus cerbereus TaxID=65552 RepID=UPI003EEF9413
MIRVLSGSRLVQEALTLALGDLLLRRAVVLVADYPLGSALALLSGMQGPCVVKTASTSPFYLSDLVALGPTGLVLESAGLEFLKVDATAGFGRAKGIAKARGGCPHPKRTRGTAALGSRRLQRWHSVPSWH